MKIIAPLLIGLALLAACKKPAEAPPPAPAAAPAAATAPAPAPAAGPGFDPASAPIANPNLGAWPYFSLINGYVAMTRENQPGDSAKDYLKDVNFDRYEFWDGSRFITVDGRLKTVRADGKGASFFEVQKTYEKLVKNLGGVTVFEGKGTTIDEKKVMFADRRHRAYNVTSDEMGVYMVRTPDREIWVEVYRPWNSSGDNYWLTVVEKKALEARANVLPAEEMKRALDKDGHVALYINFDTDKTAIKPDSAPIITEIAKLLAANPTLKLTVEGHTDNAGSAAHNQTLSEGRANAVVGALIAQGVAYDRLQPKGFGAAKPLADNASEDGRAKNRRVELVKR